MLSVCLFAWNLKTLNKYKFMVKWTPIKIKGEGNLALEKVSQVFCRRIVIDSDAKEVIDSINGKI